MIAGVEVTATNLDTNLARSIRTDLTGEYRILALPGGRYKLAASVSGFQKFTASGIDLDVNQQRRLDITMQVGSLEQQVEIKAAALAIETTATQLGEAINARKLVSLPLNARSYMDLPGLLADFPPATSPSMANARQRTHSS